MGRYEKLLSLEGGQKVVAYFHTSCAPGDAAYPARRCTGALRYGKDGAACAECLWWRTRRRYAEVIALNLRMAGYDVTEAGSAEAALAAIDTSAPFDVAVLDIMLPGMNGFSLCENIRRDSDSIGIIMLSAKSQEDDKIRGLSIGADDYMTKPFSVSELLARVDALCRRVARAAGQDAGQEAEGRIYPAVLFWIEKPYPL